MKKVTEIKQYAKAQGFENQKDFFAHVKHLRELRAANKPQQTELSLSERAVDRDRQYREYFKNACPELNKSIHARYMHSVNLKWDTVRYSNSSGCRPLDYCNVSYYRAGNKLYSKVEYRGKQTKKFIELPADWRDYIYVHEGLLSNEVGKIKHGVLQRFNFDFKKIGVAVQMPDPFNPGKLYWEHASSIKGIKYEHGKKIEAFKYHEESKKLARKARLIARLCNRVTLTVEDCLDAGNCKEGVSNFMSHNGLDGLKKITLGELKKFSANDRVKRIINYVSVMTAQIAT